MKRYLLFLALSLTFTLQAQAPQGFNYQATVRNSSGDLILNTNVYFKFNVIQGSQTAVPIFTETHYVPTDDLGQVNLVIGQGTASTGVFSELDWSLGSYYLGIELDTGSGYVAMGTTQLLSVPYALYAENSGNSTPTTTNLEAVLAENNSANNQQIKDLQDPTDAQDAVTKAYADNLVSAIGYQQWSDNQVWDDNTTISPQPNSFWFINAENTTITLPPLSNQGDVIKIYYMGAGINNYVEATSANSNSGHITFIDAQTNNLFVGFKSFDQNNYYTDGFGYFNGGIKPVKLQYGLNEIIQVGDYWMLGEIEVFFGAFDFDNDGYSINQGDCDENNTQVNPGATEIEDGIDNDCDGEIDEGFSNNSNIDMTNGTFTQCEGVLYDSGGDLDNYSGNEDYTLTICPDGSGTSTVLEFISFVTQGSGADELTIFNGTTTSDPILGTYSGTQTIGTITATNTSGCLTLRFVSNGGVNLAGFAANISCEFSGTVTDQDGNTYDYLTYGDQVWTVENAEMVTYRDGTPIPQVTDNTEWENLTTGAWSYYNNDPTKPRLYNWYAVMGIHDTDPNTPNKEFAPEGWHVPTDEEWTTLENYLITNGYNSDGTTSGNKIAKAMASTTGWSISTDVYAIGNDQSINNSSGFNAFPEGLRITNGSFYDEGGYAIFWSSTESNTNSAWYRNLDDYNIYLNRFSRLKREGFSVRFVRD